MTQPSVQFEHVTKHFRRGAGHDSLRDLLVAAARRLRGRAGPRRLAGRPAAAPGRDDTFVALDDVSFQVGSGEALGLIGPNGAGKSTALKLLAGILRPGRGRVSVAGRLAALIEVGAGFHGDLSGRENVFLNGAILGMSRREIQAKLDAIVDFAGVGAFLDTPVKRYSSGMYARLGFAIAAHVDPEVLLVDEVLSVGDAVFRLRCVERMRQLIAGGAALVFVTHNLDQVQVVCQRALVLDRGRSAFLGPARDAVAHYMRAMSHAYVGEAAPPPSPTGRGVGGEGGAGPPPAGPTAAQEVELVALRFTDDAGREVLWTRPDAPLRAVVTLRLRRPFRRLMLELNMRRTAHENLLSLNSGRDDVTFDVHPGEHTFTLELPMIPASGGQYAWNVRAWDADRGSLELDSAFGFPLMLDDGGRTNGVFCIPHTWRNVLPDQGSGFRVQGSEQGYQGSGIGDRGSGIGDQRLQIESDGVSNSPDSLPFRTRPAASGPAQRRPDAPGGAVPSSPIPIPAENAS